ncbi:hypothetical protein, partial [Pectobacterium brasiliense]
LLPLLNKEWFEKNPNLYLFFYISLASFFIVRLFILRNSYKYANDLILAISAGWIGVSYLLTGQKVFDELPEYDLLVSNPEIYYTIVFKFIMVASSLLSKCVITYIEFIRAWRAEEKSFTGISAKKRIELFFKKLSTIKKIKK